MWRDQKFWGWWCKSFEDDGVDWFSRSGKDCCNQSTIPLSLLILGCLRILGRRMCMAGVNELTNISIEAYRVFFHQFCYLFANRMFDIYCPSPSTPNEIAIVSGEYRVWHAACLPAWAQAPSSWSPHATKVGPTFVAYGDQELGAWAQARRHAACHKC